jgi:hypothetical protein
MNTIDAMKQALEALKRIRRQLKSWDEGDKAIADLEQAIKQEEEARLEARMMVEPYSVTWSGVVFKHDK